MILISIIFLVGIFFCVIGLLSAYSGSDDYDDWGMF